MIYLIILVIIICLSILLLVNKRKQVVKDWKSLEYLKKRTNEVSTKEEIEEFHKEFVEKSNKICNQFIKPELSKIDGYLRGLYKQFK